MKRTLIIALLFLTSISAFSQGRIRIAYLDMEYILEKLPEYQLALKELENKAQKWKLDIEQKTKEIENLKNSLEQEKILLTKELLQERKEEIAFKEKELLSYQLNIFGPSGSYILQKQRLVKPIQDRVFVAVTKLVQSAKYDIVFDKANDNLGLIYTSKKLDISDKILKSISKVRKAEEREEKKKKKKIGTKKLTDAQQKRLSKTAKKKFDRQEKRKKILEERKRKKEEARKKRKEKKKTKETPKISGKKIKDTIKNTIKNKDTVKSKYGNKLTPEQLEVLKKKANTAKKKKLTPEEIAAKRKKDREERRKRILEERRKKKEKNKKNK